MNDEIILDDDISPLVDAPRAALPPLEREVQALRDAFRVETLRILVAPSAQTYLSILQRLRLARKFENGDMPHEALFDAVNDALRRMTGEEMEPRTFVDRLQELVEDDLIKREWEPRSDQSINNFLWDYHRYRISDEANRLLGMLERAARARARKPSTIEAKHNLRIIRERLGEIQRETRGLYADSQISPEERRRRAQAAYQDASRLFRQEFTEFRDFLSDLTQVLLEYGRSSNPTSVEGLDRVIQRLEAYVDEMLLFVRSNSEAITQSCNSIFLRGIETLETGYAVDLSEGMDPLTLEPPTSDTHPDPQTVLLVMRTYFGDTGPGTLNEAVKRIREATVSTIKRLREHYERLLQRTHFGEYLRLRIGEALALAPTPERFDPVVDWTNQLFSPMLVATAPRLGRPGEPGEPIAPHKRYEYQKPPILGVKAKRAQSSPPPSTPEHATLLRRMDEFVLTRILKGRESAPISDLDLQTFEEFRLLVEAVKQSNLVIGGPVSDRLQFMVVDPRRRPTDPLNFIEWRTEAGRFRAPTLEMRIKPPRDPWKKGRGR